LDLHPQARPPGVDHSLDATSLQPIAQSVRTVRVDRCGGRRGGYGGRHGRDGQRLTNSITGGISPGAR
jgi:hypothetical protein